VNDVPVLRQMTATIAMPAERSAIPLHQSPVALSLLQSLHLNRFNPHRVAKHRYRGLLAEPVPGESC